MSDERVSELEAELERVERKLKRLQSIVVWTGWIAALALLGFLLAKTLFSGPPEAVQNVAPAPIPTLKKPAKSDPKPIYDPPPSVSPPAEMPGFSE